MKKSQSFEFANALGVKLAPSQSRNGWVISDCPFGHWRHEKGKSSHEAFGFKIEPGLSHCSCFSCHWNGDQNDLVTELNALNKVDPSGKTYDFKTAMKLISQAEDEYEVDTDYPDIEEYLNQKSDLHDFPQWWLDSFPPALEIDFAADYLAERHVSPALALKMDLRADTSQKRLCAPVRDWKGALRGLHGRDVTDQNELRYRMYTYQKKNNPIVWYGENWIDLDRPIVVVEGMFDVWSVMRVYDNVTTPLYASPNWQKIKRMSGAHEWITLLDHGKGGDAGRAQYDKYLKESHIVRHAFTPDPDKDPGKSSVAEIKSALAGLIEFTT